VFRDEFVVQCAGTSKTTLTPDELGPSMDIDIRASVRECFGMGGDQIGGSAAGRSDRVRYNTAMQGGGIYSRTTISSTRVC